MCRCFWSKASLQLTFKQWTFFRQNFQKNTYENDLLFSPPLSSQPKILLIFQFLHNEFQYPVPFPIFRIFVAFFV